MSARVARVLLITAASLIWLSGCETWKGVDLSGFKGGRSEETAEAKGDPADPQSTGSIAAGVEVNPVSADLAAPGLLGSDPTDDLSLGKKQFREQNFGLAEQHFRRAVEARPRDAEAWLGLAASYDRLRRFDLADRAYRQVLNILGPTPSVLNNLGFSYMLRGDYKNARAKLLAAQAQDPNNPHVKANLTLLDESIRSGKGIGRQ
jgi:tetratricopeptide (TPR) repeat protein